MPPKACQKNKIKYDLVEIICCILSSIVTPDSYNHYMKKKQGVKFALNSPLKLFVDMLMLLKEPLAGLIVNIIVT